MRFCYTQLNCMQLRSNVISFLAKKLDLSASLFIQCNKVGWLVGAMEDGLVQWVSDRYLHSLLIEYSMQYSSTHTTTIYTACICVLYSTAL